MQAPTVIAKPIFIVGCDRTGTLLQQSLSQHQDCDILPETQLFTWLWSPWRGVASRDAEQVWRHVAAALPRISPRWALPENETRMARVRSAIECVPKQFESVAHVMEFLLRHAPERRSTGTRVGEQTPLHLFYVRQLVDRFADAKIVIAPCESWGAADTPNPGTQEQDRQSGTSRDLASWPASFDLVTQYERDYGSATVHVVRAEELASQPRAAMEKLCEFVELSLREEVLTVVENRTFNAHLPHGDPGATQAGASSSSLPGRMANWFVSHYPRLGCYLAPRFALSKVSRPGVGPASSNSSAPEGHGVG